MTYTPTFQLLDGADDPASVLAHAREQKRASEQAERNLMADAATFLAMHSTDSFSDPPDEWHEKALPMGGEGCPRSREFAIVEWAAAMGCLPRPRTRYLSKVAEGRYRLRRCWARLEAKKPAGLAARDDRRTHHVPVPGGGGVRRHHVAPVADKIGPPADAADRGGQGPVRPRADRGRRAAPPNDATCEIDLAVVGVAGTVHVDADLDLADALDLETAVAHLAHQLLARRVHRVAGRPPLHGARSPGPRRAAPWI